MKHFARPLACLALMLGNAAPAEQALDTLARNVSREESLRAVKNVQRLYAHHAQLGQWSDAAALFEARGGFTIEDETHVGRGAIAGFLRNHYGNGRDGIRSGDLHTMLIDSPVVHLSADGNSALGRWQVLILVAASGKARIEGGIFENRYVRRGDAWQIASLVYHPQFEGPYEAGWSNRGGGDLPIIPYHFTPDSAGVPIAPPAGAAPPSATTLGKLQARITALNDDDQIRNLQSAYGYYADRKIWDDVVDLFSADGAVEIAGIGVYRGPAGIRRWLASIGPPGLNHGELNDRPQFDTIVTVAPGGREAWARGIELGMLGDANKQQGAWEVAVFSNRFVREGGVWKIRELHRFPLLKADYFKGWGQSRIVDTSPTGKLAPHSRAAWRLPPDPATHPLSLTGPILPGHAIPIALAEARRRLSLSTAYDAVENISSAYGSFLDDFQSPLFSALIAEKGFKVSAFAGYYVGRERVTEAGVRVWGKPPVTRRGISYHWRTQPVILVSADGRSANARFRLFQLRTGKPGIKPDDFYAANFWSGMYHDQMVLEHGTWKFWNLSLDEPYINPVSWKGGWAMAKDPVAAPTAKPSVLLDTFPPDIPITALGRRAEHFRGGTGVPLQWPSILPMWFEYRNPVSGRVPEHYQADCVPCAVAPQLRLDRNGYQMPPTGPWPPASKARRAANAPRRSKP